jgi:uncharacterized protein YkwD
VRFCVENNGVIVQQRRSQMKVHGRVYLAVLLGTALGAAPVQGLYAQQPQINPQTGAEQQAILSATNASRAKHCVPALTWSAQLAAAAQAWVNKCTITPGTNTFAHDPQRGQTGENLAWGTSLTAQQAEQLWYNEISNYNFAAPVYSSVVGHFTQLIWRTTTQVGCAKATCGGQVLLSCRFSPPGNMNVVVGPNVTAQQAQQSLRQNVSMVCR